MLILVAIRKGIDSVLGTCASRLDVPLILWEEINSSWVVETIHISNWKKVPCPCQMKIISHNIADFYAFLM